MSRTILIQHSSYKNTLTSIAANFRRQQRFADTMTAGIFSIHGGLCPEAERFMKFATNCGIIGCRQFCRNRGKTLNI